MSRIYIVTDRADASNVRFVRAHTLATALRAVAESEYHAAPASTDDVYKAMKDGHAVLDAIEPERVTL
jgi:ActR/RegA family two-component response regulator